MIRSNVVALEPYVPGEQPQEPGWIKLNTNENPFMARGIVEAVAEATTDALRFYPDPLCLVLREKLAARYAVPVRQIICGNGSDELLTLTLRLAAGEGDRVAFPWPSYSLYESLARIQNAFPVAIPLGPQWELPAPELARTGARVTLVANPNAPTGTSYRADELSWLAGALEGLLVVDEAYIDFGGESALRLIEQHENVVVLRTMSKAFGLAGMRLGYGFGSPAVVDALYKIKDSYNVDRLTQVAGIAALEAHDEAMANNREIAARRDRVAEQLRGRFQWHVWPSATNFLLVHTAPQPARAVYEGLKAQRILVRYFDTPRLADCLRISIGSETEMAALVRVLDAMLR